MLILQAEQNRTREMLLAAKEKELARKEQEMRKKTAVGEVFTMTDILNQLTKIYKWLSPKEDIYSISNLAPKTVFHPQNGL